MSPQLSLIIIVLALFVSIGIGWKTGKNIGYWSIAFAYVLGVFVFGLTTKEVLSAYPSGLLITLIAIMAFYNYANANGAMGLLARKILYPMRNSVRLLPIGCFLVGWGMSAIIGSSAVTAFYPVIIYTIALTAGWDPIIMTIASCFGNIAGASMPWSQTGAIMKGILKDMEWAENMELYVAKTAVLITIAMLAFFILAYIVTGSYKIKKVEMEKPEPFNAIQKKTLVVVAIVALFMIVPSIGKFMFPGTWLAKQAAKFDLGLVCYCGALLCGILNLGDEKAIIKSIPMGTFIMIMGCATLVGLAQKIGATEFLGKFIATSVPKMLIGPLLVLICGVLSLFSSYTTVIAVMFPVLPAIAAASGLSPVYLLCCTLGGSLATSISPFSSGGMMNMSFCPDPVEREKLFGKQIKTAVIAMCFYVVLSLVQFFAILG
ncbi:MAG: hypothetical protein IJL66_07745 [Lachnospiraceae bacterium]|nr:hypothetical protein [Lachnospiraceae bacterium]